MKNIYYVSCREKVLKYKLIKRLEDHFYVNNGKSNLYIKRDLCYFNKKNANKRLKLEKEIFNLRTKDIVDSIPV